MVRNTYEVQNVGDLLREKRKQLGKDIKEVSEFTKIRAEYLLALETGNYDKFASDVYAKGFLKKYAKYLGISPERAAAMYRRESNPKNNDLIHNTDYLKKKLSGGSIELSPTRVFTILAVLALIGFALYLVSQVGTVLQPPGLSLATPIEAEAGTSGTYTTNLDSITIRGQVELGSTLTLNDNSVNVNNLQIFEVADLPLALGENRFTLVARSQFGQESQLELIVIREQVNQDSENGSNGSSDSNSQNGLEDEVNESARFRPVVSIQGRDAYVQVRVDGQIVFAQVLGEGQAREFEVESELAISSPRPDAVVVQILEEQFTLQSPSLHRFSYSTSAGVNLVVE